MDSYKSCLAKPKPDGRDENGEVNFVEAAISNKHRCTALRRNDCLFYHEATEKCSCLCQELVTSGKDSIGGPEKAAAAKAQSNPNWQPWSASECFHADDRVTTNRMRRSMKMSELKKDKNVQVLTYSKSKKSFEFAPVQYWTHAGEKMSADFLIFTTESGQNLSITEHHLIYKTDCQGKKQTVFAKKVQIGNCLLVNIDDRLVESKVIERKIENKMGIYTPVTSNGNIVVNDILASCYTNMENENIQHLMYSFLIAIRDILSHFLPSSWIEIAFSSPFASAVDVPPFLQSFLSLAKGFVRLN
jgi:hypothetical protein